MHKFKITILILFLNQLIFSQDSRQIQVFYGRMNGGIVVDLLIKYDKDVYKIKSEITQLNNNEVVTKKNEIKITRSEFKSYYKKLIKYNESKNSVSRIEEDNQLTIKISGGIKTKTIELMPVVKSMKENNNYKTILELMEEIFLKTGLKSEYLYLD
jgi:hypothetical protein